MEYAKDLTVKVSHNPTSGNFFIDLWEINTEEEPGKYLVSVKVSENVTNCIARDIGVKIIE